MIPSILDQQLRHMQWADSIIWAKVLSCPAAQSDPHIRELLRHTHLVQHLYLQIWRGEPFAVRELDSFPDLATLQAWGQGFHAEAESYFAEVGVDELKRVVLFPWTAQLEARFGVVHPATVEESTVQVVLHTTHHRAQMCMRLRELGGEPPLVDFIAWIWSGRPTPRWIPLPAA